MQQELRRSMKAPFSGISDSAQESSMDKIYMIERIQSKVLQILHILSHGFGIVTNGNVTIDALLRTLRARCEAAYLRGKRPRTYGLF